MTFYEAAVEVLRRSGRPLHFKKITEVAIRDELLSHVGKTPEATMEDRLDQETKKDDASWIVRTRPGVYMLRSEVAERLNDEAQKREEAARKKQEAGKERLAAKAAVEESEAEDEDESDEELEDLDQPADIEDEDEDEDEDEADAEAAGDEDGAQRSGRRRRRRRGRRRGGDGAAEPEAATEDEKPVRAKAPEREPSAREEKAPSDDRRRSKSKRSSAAAVDAGNLESLEGERFDSISDAALAVVRASGRKPLSAAAIAEVVFEKKLVKFHTHDPESTIQAAIVTDNQVRSRGGRRPLFSQYREGRWGLTEWGVSEAGVEKERQILELAGDLRREALDQLGNGIAGLKAEAFEMVVMTLLERLDYRNLKVSKRTSEGDTYFSADWRRGFSDMRVCVHVSSSADAVLKASAVKELRGTLEHYSAAEGIIVHVGEVSKDAVRESRNEDAAKVTIIDRRTLVRLLVDEGIGVTMFQTPIVMVDTAFMDALQT